MREFSTWWVNLAWSDSATPLIWGVGMLMAALVYVFVVRVFMSPEDRNAEREMRVEFLIAAKRNKGATFISDFELRQRREDCSPEVSRGFIFALQDFKERTDGQ